MKKIILFFAVIIFTIKAIAQIDAKAKAVLDVVNAKLKALTSMKANFVITIAGAKGKVNQTKKGVVNMKGNKYKVSLSDQEIFCDDKTVWTYIKESNEVQINNFDENESAFSPSKLFTNFYDNEYSSKYLGERKEGAKTIHIIELTPSKKSKQFSKVELKIDKVANIIFGGKVFEKNGNVYNYSVTNYVSNPILADNIFVFDTKKYPKVEVIDLR